ncbi:craniofacial development protein 1 [Eupeodes corollae]|uniref:craniofacial development protein 1 n=1 Tax=Eupeodes corollae TaxID=290404 RepID=UPI002490488B|nr:craniofacial development protein 1 [Eupeodes corollae]
MNKEEHDYASDSDESDEDFCPDKANNSGEDDAPSEEDSDDPISENEDVPASKKPKSNPKKKDRSKQTPSTKVKKTNKESVVKEKENKEEERIVTTRNRSETTSKTSIEKDELDSDEEDSSRKEALWADFLSDIPTTTTPSRTNKPAASASSKKEASTRPTVEKQDTPIAPKEPEKVVIKQLFDFAGEEVVVEKTVSADSIKSNGSSRKLPASSLEGPRGSVKRPAGGGIGSILGQLDKKKKISVLEKSKLDWDSFKTTEGIDEDLQTFNKGKDGYLQRQDFLERTDLRQFEIEKSLRASRRKPM